MIEDTKLRREGTILWYESGLSGKALLPKDTGLALSRIARAGTHESHPVTEVRVTFSDAAAAEYNADALAFLGLKAWAAGTDLSSNAQFPARADFGIEE